MTQILTIIIYVLTTAGGLIILKLGSTGGAFIQLVDGKLDFNPSALNLLGVLLYGLSFILYTFLIAKNDLGYIIPLTTALVYGIIFFASFIIFKESFTAHKVAGILLIFFGVLLLNAKII